MPLISFIIGASLLPLSRSSVALIDPANSSRLNPSSSSSARSFVLSASLEKFLVISSLKSDGEILTNLKDLHKNLEI